MEFNEAWSNACSSVGLACREGNYDALESLLSNGAEVDIQDNRGWRPIHEAAANNHVKCLQLVLRHKKNDVNCRSFEGETPLLVASRAGHADAVQMLLLKGADPNITNNESESPLMFAAKLQSLSCVRYLLDAGADVNEQDFNGSTPLHHAMVVKCSDASVVTELVARGADISANDYCQITPLFQAARVGFLSALKVLLERAKTKGCSKALIDKGAEDGATPLMIAAQQGFVECVDFLLQNGADCNCLTDDHVSALHLAVQFGHSDCVKLLLDKMDGSIWRPYTNVHTLPPDNCIGSPLHLAIYFERHDILKSILRSGINPNFVFSHNEIYCLPEMSFFRDNQINPGPVSGDMPQYISALALASCKGSIEDIVVLMEYGAKINAEPSHFMCPVLIAVCAGHVHVVEFLLRNGANPNSRDGCARSFYRRMLILPVLKTPMLRLLLKYGADPRPALSSVCVKSHLGTCNEIEYPALKYQEKHHRTVAVLQEFLSAQVLEDYIDKMFREVQNLSAEEDQCWKRIFENSRNPPALAHLCRLKIRERLMDNGSGVFPFSKRLESLPVVPLIIAQYLAFQ